MGADAWRRTGVLTFDGNTRLKTKVNYSRIQQCLQEKYNHKFSYGLVVQLCVARNRRHRATKNYHGAARVTSRRARKGFELRYNPDTHWSNSLYKGLNFIEYTDGTEIININRDDAAGVFPPNCEKCAGFCEGHFLDPEAAVLSTLPAMKQPPSAILKEFHSSLKVVPSDSELEEIARKAMLPVCKVKIWLEHLSTIVINCKRGAAKAAQTRHQRRTAKKQRQLNKEQEQGGLREGQEQVQEEQPVYHCGTCGSKYEELMILNFGFVVTSVTCGFMEYVWELMLTIHLMFLNVNFVKMHNCIYLMSFFVITHTPYDGKVWGICKGYVGGW